MTGSLNLAHRPFLNTRPVQRAAAALWLLGMILLASNVSLFWTFLDRSAAQRAELAEINEEIAAERAAIANLEAGLSGLDLAEQNERVEFLNAKIAQRTFSWSQLLDRLAAVLPDGVRLVSLQPQQESRVEGRSRRRDDGGQVILALAGQARSDTSLLQFVDNLFGHPAFGEPDPTRDRRREEDDLLDFNLTVAYRPAGVPQPALAPATAALATEPAAAGETEQR
jgi:Tfp pilus assembly protein PilN